MIKTMEYIKNGNFINGFKGWQGPDGFKPDSSLIAKARAYACPQRR
jgi:hypothetical protein